MSDELHNYIRANDYISDKTNFHTILINFAGEIFHLHARTKTKDSFKFYETFQCNFCSSFFLYIFNMPKILQKNWHALC
jgi:hypothetical protein